MPHNASNPAPNRPSGAHSGRTPQDTHSIDAPLPANRRLHPVPVTSLRVGDLLHSDGMVLRVRTTRTALVGAYTDGASRTVLSAHCEVLNFNEVTDPSSPIYNSFLAGVGLTQDYWVTDPELRHVPGYLDHTCCPLHAPRGHVSRWYSFPVPYWTVQGNDRAYVVRVIRTGAPDNGEDNDGDDFYWEDNQS